MEGLLKNTMAIKLTVASSENTKISGVQDKVFFLP
jgi:hypothetical protein